MTNESIEMADVLRQSGKIYVVISVLVVIFVSLMAYLFLQDRKLKDLENKLKNKE